MGGFLGSILDPLTRIGLPLMKNALKPLVKSILIPSRLTTLLSAADARISKNFFGSGDPRIYGSGTTTLSNFDLVC